MNSVAQNLSQRRQTNIRGATRFEHSPRNTWAFLPTFLNVHRALPCLPFTWKCWG